MEKNAKVPADIFPEIIGDYRRHFGDDLISIVLYGSATGKEYRPGKSDINFMIIITEQGIERLDLAFGIVKKWRRKNVAIPLFLTESYVETSTDVFPIEYLSFQRNYLLIHGKDILKGLTFRPEFLRLQCEREIKAKLLLLREAFLETGGRAKALKGVIGRSITAFAAVCDALLYLRGKDLPGEKRGSIRAMAHEFDIDAGVFDKLFDLKEGKVKLDDSEVVRLFKNYLKEMRKLAVKVDALGE